MSDWILIFAVVVAKSYYERNEKPELKLKAMIRSNVNEWRDVTENLKFQKESILVYGQKLLNHKYLQILLDQHIILNCFSRIYC